MTDKEVLQKALKIAVKNGFRWNTMMPKVVRVSPNLELLIDLEGKTQVSIGSSDLIFSHDFAKAFWKSKDFYDIIISWRRQTSVDSEKIDHEFITNDWNYHLTMMVIEPNPIDYLRKFIEI